MPYGHIDDFKSDPEFYKTLKNEKLEATDIFVGETPRGKTPFDFTINGVTVGNLKSDKLATLNSKKSDPKKRLNLKLENNSYRYADLTYVLTDNSIQFLENLITENKEPLIDIANKYESGGRQFFNFLYDLSLLIKTLSQLPDEFNVLLNDIGKTAEILMHNSVVANIAEHYKNSGYCVSIEPSNLGNKPDLLVDKEYAEIKTILTPKENDQRSLEEFVEKIKHVHVKARNQVGKNGMVFISPWSGIINSLFYSFYYEMKIKKIHDFNDCQVFTSFPSFQKGKSVIVVTTPKAFVDYYLVFDSNWLIDAMSLFARSRYKLFDNRENMMDYLKIQPPLRTGFPVGDAGNRGISFAVN